MSNTTSTPPLLPPTFTQHLTDLSCEEGQGIELVTRITGAEEVVWMKNDRLIPNSPYFRYVHDPAAEIYKLVIQDVFIQDSGLYICEAYNKYGGSITFATLTVTETPPRVAGSNFKNENVNSQQQKLAERMESEKVDGDARESDDVTLKLRKNDLFSEETSKSAETDIKIQKISVEVERDGISVEKVPEKIHASNTHSQIPDFDETGIDSTGDVSHIETVQVSVDLTETSEMDSEPVPSDLSVEYAVSELIEAAQRSLLLGRVEVLQPLTANQQAEDSTNLAFPETAPAATLSESNNTRHDSGIIAGLDTECEKSIEEEFSSSPTSAQSSPVQSCILQYKGSTFSTSLRDDSLGKSPTVMGPTYLIAMKGEMVVIRIKYSGVPHAKVKWTKNGKECVNVVENSELSSLRIEKVDYDDSGRYTASICNDHGTILHHCFLDVEGPPEPPSTPPTTVFNETTNTLSISWSGSPYDGGSIITGYIVEASIDEAEWTELAVVSWLTYSLVSPSPGATYRFRVQCKNMYGVGSASGSSPPATIPGTSTELTTAADSEEQLLEFKDVEIRRGSFQDFYIKGEELGKGRFGVVFNAQHKETKAEFAGKIIRCIKAADKAKVRQEVEIMNILRHPKLLQIADALENDKEICIITEKINGGELFERVVADDFTLTEFDCIGFMRQICDGVRFMHQKNVIHLDLKPENILCVSRSTYNIKIIDFGLSQKYDSSVPLRVLFGTPEFIAPEIINYEPISPASDMWAVGVITYVLLSGLSPFMGESDSETFSNITQGLFDFDDEAFDCISEDAKDFISKLLIRRQEKRLTISECLTHKWLAYPEPKKNIVIATDKLKRFIIRRKWQKTGNAIRALGRMTNLYCSRKSGSSTELPAAASSETSKCVESGTEQQDSKESSLEVESEDEIQMKRQLLQRQHRVDSSSTIS